MIQFIVMCTAATVLYSLILWKTGWFDDDSSEVYFGIVCGLIGLACAANIQFTLILAFFILSIWGCLYFIAPRLAKVFSRLEDI